MSDCEHCIRDAEQDDLCRYHIVRSKLAGVSVGDAIYVNDYGPLMVRRITERANYKGEYVDTSLRLTGNDDDGKLLRMKIYCNDSGTRGGGRPSFTFLDSDGNRRTGATHIHDFRFSEVPDSESIIAEQTASDLLGDSLR